MLFFFLSLDRKKKGIEIKIKELEKTVRNYLIFILGV